MTEWIMSAEQHAALERKVTDRDATIAAKDAEIDRLTGVVQHASEVIAERDFTIKVYEGNFGPRLDGSLAEKVERLQAMVDGRDWTIEIKNDEIARLRRALERVVDADKAQDCYEIARAALEKP